ncbi:MAG: OmpA family protein [Proteobacteria bacterium]|nr:OmpA family protein [Pseudomonadota bacterium]
MNWKSVIVLAAAILMAGCGTKENFVVLSPTNDGSVGALKVVTEKGSEVLTEDGKAIFIGDRNSAPSTPTPINAAETQLVFQDALRVHPLMPESFILYFQFNSNELTDESKKQINNILVAIKKRQSRDISVIGHTDRTGRDEYKRKLSLERAQLVYNILRSEEVTGEDMTIIYHGEGNPLIPTADNIAEPRNRRVEVMVR